jgi:enoyl-CoA hydratase/carnithine racemase
VSEVDVSAEDAPVLVEARDGKLIVTLNRPQALNAQNQEMREALVAAVDRLESDDELRVGIIKGAGRAFSAGADLKELQAGTAPSEGRMFVHFDRVWWCNKPLIAAVHGHAAGGGFELAQLCDIRIATTDAQFSQPEARSIGRIAPIATQHLELLLGRGEAMLLHLSGLPMSGERAYQLGLVQRLVDQPDQLLPVAEAIADAMMLFSNAALEDAKRILRKDIGVIAPEWTDHHDVDGRA